MTSTSNDLDAAAMRHLAFRAGLTGAMFVGYSSFVLGNRVSNAVLLNAATAAGSAVAAETAVKYVAPHIVNYKAQGLNGGLPMLAEGVLTGVIYSQAFPRVFPALAGTTSMQELATVGAGIDIAAQVVGPRVGAMLSGEQSY
jgi:hypothetical protein